MTPYAEDIRTVAQTLLEQEAVAAGRPYVRVRDTSGWPLSADEMPALSVIMHRELMSPDGASNDGEPSFIHDCSLAVIVTLGFARPEDLHDELKIRTQAIYRALLSNVSFRLPVPGEPPLFESIERIEAVNAFDRDGETFIAEAQLNFTVRFRTDWPPEVLDDFESIAVTLKRPGHPVPVDPTIILTVPQE